MMAVRDTIQKASAKIDDLNGVVRPLGRAKPSAAVLKQILTLISDLDALRISIDESSEKVELNAEEQAILIGDIDLPLLAQRIIWAAPTVQNAKDLASTMLALIDQILKNWSPDAATVEVLNFDKSRIQTILAYPATPNAAAPDWSKLVGSPFWQYPPEAGGGLGLWALLAAGAAYLYSR